MCESNAYYWLNGMHDQLSAIKARTGFLFNSFFKLVFSILQKSDVHVFLLVRFTEHVCVSTHEDVEGKELNLCSCQW